MWDAIHCTTGVTGLRVAASLGWRRICDFSSFPAESVWMRTSAADCNGRWVGKVYRASQSGLGAHTKRGGASLGGAEERQCGGDARALGQSW